MTNQITHTNFNIKEFKKIEDIIFLDEPILTHLTRNGKHYFRYLVDTLVDARIDIFLLLELKEEVIYSFLKKEISLYELITTNPNFIYKLEEDFDGNIVNLEITQGILIPDGYLPDEDSFFEFKFNKSSHYFNIVN